MTDEFGNPLKGPYDLKNNELSFETYKKTQNKL